MDATGKYVCTSCLMSNGSIAACTFSAFGDHNGCCCSGGGGDGLLMPCVELPLLLLLLLLGLLPLSLLSLSLSWLRSEKGEGFLVVVAEVASSSGRRHAPCTKASTQGVVLRSTDARSATSHSYLLMYKSKRQGFRGCGRGSREEQK
jgi:hypothetical protein